MPMRLRLALLILLGVTAPMTLQGFQDRDGGVLTIGEIININTEKRSLEMESAPVGTLFAPRGRPVHGETEILGGATRIPPPGESRPAPGVNRGPSPPPATPRPATNRVPIGTDGRLDNLPTPPRQVRDRYLGFQVSTDDQTELLESGQVLDFDSLAIGDRISVLGKVIDGAISAYRIDRTPQPEEEGN